MGTQAVVFLCDWRVDVILTRTESIKAEQGIIIKISYESLIRDTHKAGPDC